MTRHNSGRLPALLLAASSVLLALLAGMQYSSTSRLIRSTHELQTEAVRASMESVRTDVAGLFEDAYAWFEMEGPVPDHSVPGFPVQLARHVAAWNAERPDGPRATAYFLEPGVPAAPDLARLDSDTGSFERVSVDALPPAVRELTRDLPGRLTEGEDGGIRFSTERSWDLSGEPFIVLPVAAVQLSGAADSAKRDRPVIGFLIVGLDRAYLMNEWIPSLLEHAVRRHPDFRLSVQEGSVTDGSQQADLIVSLVSGTSRTYEFAAPRRPMSGGEGREVAVTTGVIRESTPAAGDSGTTGASAGESVGGSAEGPSGPRLTATHAAGSLDAAWRRAMVRQFGLSLLILVVIGCSIVLLVLTARRARRLADQHSTFAAGMSHELRTPVAAIGALADNLQSGLVRDEADVREYGGLIQRERRRLHEMLEGVLAWAASGSRDSHANEPLDVAGILEDEADTRRADGGAVICVHAADRPLVVLAEESALRLIIRNVLGNALKHGPAEGPVRAEAVRAREGGRDVVRIRICDEGPGIPPDERDAVFDPFFRGRTARQNQVPGSGLGLDLVRSITRDFGGRVRVESSAAGGACFVIDLPMAEAGQ